MIMALDHTGYANYFSTRNYKYFFYQDRIKIGGVPSNFAGELDLEVRQVAPHGIHGYTVTFASHFLFQRHFKNAEDATLVCQTGDSLVASEGSELGLRQVAGDSVIQGLVYALPMSGDHLQLFQMNLGAPSPKARAAISSGERSSSNRSMRYGFASTSECNLIGSLHLENLANDRVTQMVSLKGQLLLLTEQGRMLAMEASSIE